jgi:hypothetical protein
MIAALFVQTDGVYFGLDGVEPYDVTRDAMTYDGPHPVVAHPPCARWCQLAGLVQARWGHKIGDDGGSFAHALDCVRRFGGVLEHPAYSRAWDAYDLPKPVTGGGWSRGICGGWSCYVEQFRYGHPAKKATWLYAYGTNLPSLRWGSMLAREATALVSWCGNRVASGEVRPRVGKAQASRTPIEFRDVLISIARSACAEAA